MLLLWGAVAFASLLILSVLWYRERVVFTDFAYHLFYLLKERDFAIQHGRFGTAFTQLFPLGAAALGLSLNAVSALYSASFVLLPALVFGLLLGLLKNTKLALAYLLCLVAMQTHTFFWPLSELHQGMAFLFLFAGLLEKQFHRQKLSPWLLLVGSLLLITICFLHPLLPVPVLFFLLFYGLRYPLKRKLLLGVGISFAGIWFIKALFFRQAYEQQAMGGLRNFGTLFPHYFNLQSNRNLAQYFLYDYYVVGLLLLALAGLYIRRRAWRSLGLLLAFFIGLAALINISNPGGGDQYYLENQYLLLGFFVALPAAYDLFPRVQKARYMHLLLGALVIACIGRVVRVQPFYAHRLHWFQKVLDQTALLPDRKIVFPAEVAPLDTLLMTWGTAYEFWLLSTLNGGGARSLIVEERAGEFDAGLTRNKTLITKWYPLDYAELEGPYFPFTDTNSTYVKWPVGKPLNP